MAGGPSGRITIALLVANSERAETPCCHSWVPVGEFSAVGMLSAGSLPGLSDVDSYLAASRQQESEGSSFSVHTRPGTVSHAASHRPGLSPSHGVQRQEGGFSSRTLTSHWPSARF